MGRQEAGGDNVELHVTLAFHQKASRERADDGANSEGGLNHGVALNPLRIGQRVAVQKVLTDTALVAMRKVGYVGYSLRS